jgi:hypothetical protein
VLPSGLHALAFTCLSSGCVNAGRAGQLAFAGFWVGVNAIWEACCHPDFPWPEARERVVALALGQPGMPSQCTFDMGDLLAAVVGAFLAVHFGRAVSRSSPPRAADPSGEPA